MKIHVLGQKMISEIKPRSSCFDQFDQSATEFYFEKKLEFHRTSPDSRTPYRTPVFLIIVNDAIHLIESPSNNLIASHKIQTLADNCHERPFYSLYFSRVIEDNQVGNQIYSFFIREYDEVILNKFFESARKYAQLSTSATIFQTEDYLNHLKTNYRKPLNLRSQTIQAHSSAKKNVFDEKFLEKVISHPFPTENFIIECNEFAQELVNPQEFVVPPPLPEIEAKFFPNKTDFEFKKVIIKPNLLPKVLDTGNEPVVVLPAKRNKKKPKLAQLNLTNVKHLDELVEANLPIATFLSSLFEYVTLEFDEIPGTPPLESPEASISSENSSLSISSKNSSPLISSKNSSHAIENIPENKSHCVKKIVFLTLFITLIALICFLVLFLNVLF